MALATGTGALIAKLGPANVLQPFNTLSAFLSILALSASGMIDSHGCTIAARQRRPDLYAPRNIGFAVTLPRRALKVAGTCFSAFFHQPGTRPQRICSRARSPALSSTTSTVSVGAM